MINFQYETEADKYIKSCVFLSKELWTDHREEVLRQIKNAFNSGFYRGQQNLNTDIEPQLIVGKAKLVTTIYVDNPLAYCSPQAMVEIQKTLSKPNEAEYDGLSVL